MSRARDRTTGGQLLLGWTGHARTTLNDLAAGADPGSHRKMLTARAITSPRMNREVTACTVMAALAQRASGITSVGLNAVALVKPR